MRKVIFFVVGAFLVYFVITQPHAAAVAATSLKDTLKAAGDSLSTFIVSMTQGNGAQG